MIAKMLALMGLMAAGGTSSGPLPSAVRGAVPGFSGQILVADRTHILFDERLGTAPHSAIWPWGSVSKQVTAALVMMEVDRGRLSLDDRIIDRLPDFPNADTGRATIRQLLQHMSGLPNSNDMPGNPPGTAFYTRRGAGVGGRADAYGFCAGPGKPPSGTQFSYNNCDTIVIGAILERVSDLPFATLLARRVRRPLHMASLHMARPFELPVPGRSQGRPVPRENLATYGPAGAMIGSARDLVAFDRALIDDRLLSRGARTVLWQGDPKIGYGALGAWSFPARLAGCKGDVRLIERRGSVGGVQARNIIAPDLGRMVVAFTDDADYDFGEIWQGRGAAYRLLSAALCT
ncbi:MAG TPA: serine hydrolase domain-containing protein [Sphingomonas sp.]